MTDDGFDLVVSGVAYYASGYLCKELPLSGVCGTAEGGIAEGCECAEEGSVD